MQLFQSIGNLFQQFWEGIINGFCVLVETIGNLLSHLFGVFEKVKNAVGDFFGGLFGSDSEESQAPQSNAEIKEALAASQGVQDVATLQAYKDKLPAVDQAVSASTFTDHASTIQSQKTLQQATFQSMTTSSVQSSQGTSIHIDQVQVDGMSLQQGVSAEGLTAAIRQGIETYFIGLQQQQRSEVCYG